MEVEMGLSEALMTPAILKPSPLIAVGIEGKTFETKELRKEDIRELEGGGGRDGGTLRGR